MSKDPWNGHGSCRLPDDADYVNLPFDGEEAKAWKAEGRDTTADGREWSGESFESLHKEELLPVVTVLSGKHFGVYHDTVFAMRHLQRGVTNLSGLLAKDRSQQSLLRRQLGLTLGSHLPYQNIARTDLAEKDFRG